MNAPLHTGQPDDLPPPVEGPSAWYGPDMLARESDWIVPFSPAHVAEVEQAAKAALARGTDIAQIDKADFPLPTLGPVLAEALETLLTGRGFMLFRGLPVGDWPAALSAAAFVGIGRHLGNPKSQNGKGHILGHVRDLGLASDDPNVRIYQTRERQTFHTDSCDVVGLLCLKAAKSGGHSALVSSMTIYNEMHRRRPDLLPHLLRPVATDRRGEVSPGQKPYFEIPVFSAQDGLISVIYQRQYINSAQRFEDAPRLSPETVEALDLFDALANDPALNFTMVLQPGDLQFVHNHTILHDRTGFEDWEDDTKKRHLLRLWLAPESARPLPPAYAQRYGSVTPGERGGIILPDTRLHAPLTPL